MIKNLNPVSQKSLLFDLLKEYKTSFIYVGVASMFSNVLMLVPTLYMLQMYDRVLASKSEYTLLMLTILVIFLYIMLAGVELIRSRILVRIGNRLDEKLSGKIFSLMFSFANDRNELITSKPLSDLNTIKQFLTGSPIIAIFNAPWAPIYFAVLFYFSVWFGLFAIVISIVSIIFMILNEKKTKAPLEEANKAFQDSSNMINASLRNAEVIDSMGMHENIRRIWYAKYVQFLNLQSIASDEAGFWSNASSSFRIMAQSLIMGLGAYLAVENYITPGMMIAGSLLLGRALSPLDLLTHTWRQFINARMSYHRLEELLKTSTSKDEPMKLPEPNGRLTIENIIVFPPGSSNPALKSINMDILPGELVAVIGPSASGKSTLARTIIGVWKAKIGKIRIDMAEIEHWNKSELGRYLGYLPQDVELFDGSIAANIARFNEIDPDKVVQAAQTAGIHEMILCLPNGYDTNIGIGGATLSGGQRQRIGLARALYGFPKIIVLDEPNSNLDDTGEQALVSAILELKKRKSTIVLITHRPSILGIVDKIAVLANGSLQMYGDKNEVLAALAQRKELINIK